MITWIVGKDLIKTRYHQKKRFYKKLDQKNISDEDYAHA